MISIKINFNQILMLLFVATFIGFSSCKIDELPDPNNPSLGVITSNASRSEIQNLVDAITSGMRNNMGTYLDGVGVVGREYYRVSASDPRFTSDLLGKNDAVLDANTFYTTNPFSARYRVVKNANVLIDAVTNTSAALSDGERSTAIGFAKTIKAHQLLLVLNMQYGNAIRIDVSDPDNLGPFLADQNASLDAIASLLDDGAADLARGTDFPFSLNAGDWGIANGTAADFALLNRAIAARVDLYRSDWQGALDALDASFFNISGGLDMGAYLPFSTSGGDQLNPMWYPANSTGEFRVAHPSFNADIRANDARIAKVSQRDETAFSDGLSSDFDVNLYASNTASLPIVRNEELILIYAEASAQLGVTADAVAGIERIMNDAAGIAGSYTGGTGKDALVDEILYQRRYSLYGEGHRWVDMRRNGKLGNLPIDRTGDDVWVQFPRPANEN